MKEKDTTVTFTQKMRVLTKLRDFGCRTEKELSALTMEQILKIPNITIPDMTVIAELQKSVRTNKLYSYLGGESDDGQSAG